MHGTFELNEGLYVYSVKRLCAADRRGAIERLRPLLQTVSADVLAFMQLTERAGAPAHDGGIA